MKVFMIFSRFEVWYFSSLNTWNNIDCFLMYSRGENIKLQIIKKILLVPFFIKPIILVKGMIWYNVQLSKYFFKMPAIWDTLIFIIYICRIFWVLTFLFISISFSKTYFLKKKKIIKGGKVSYQRGHQKVSGECENRKDGRKQFRVWWIPWYSRHRNETQFLKMFFCPSIW